MGVVGTAPMRPRVGHGVEEGVTEGGWVFATGPTLGDRSLGCSVAGLLLFEVGGLHLMKGGEAGSPG